MPWNPFSRIMIFPRAEAMSGRCSDKPFIVPVFIPHRGCPHRCVFCNQKAITGTGDKGLELEREIVREGIDTFLAYRRPNRKRTEISFYGGTFLGLGPDVIQSLMDLAQGYVNSQNVDGLRFSTRPDTVTPEILDLIAPYSVDTIELGVQSMDPGVLEASMRGHTADDTRNAVRLLKDRGYRIGLQMMTGLPGDTCETALDTGRAIADLKPDFVRIYPTVVLKHSPLARHFQKGVYRPLDLEASVNLAKQLYLIFHKANIPVIRMGLQASEGLDPDNQILAGPYHPSFGHMVYSALFLDMAVKLIEHFPLEKNRSVTFNVHPTIISVLRGLKNSNIQILKSRFDLEKVHVKSDETLDRETLKLAETVTSLTRQD